MHAQNGFVGLPDPGRLRRPCFHSTPVDQAGRVLKTELAYSPFADADGFVTPSQIPQLVGPTDPYLFNSNAHFDDVVAFESLVLNATLSFQRQAPNLIVSWPLPGTGLILQTTATPDQSASWAEVTLPYEIRATDNFVTVPISTGRALYRLAEE